MVYIGESIPIATIGSFQGRQTWEGITIRRSKDLAMNILTFVTVEARAVRTYKRRLSDLIRVAAVATLRPSQDPMNIPLPQALCWHKSLTVVKSTMAVGW